SKSRTPNSACKSCSWRERAGCVIRSVFAALETVPCSATTTNVRSRLRSIALLMLRKHQFTDQLCIGSMKGSMPYPSYQNTNQERKKTMSLKINDVAPDFDATDFEGVGRGLLDLVQGTTACSSTVFYGLLAWANLPTDNPSNAHTLTKHTG